MSLPTQAAPRHDFVRWIRAVLRGQGQVFFIDKPIAGLLMLIGVGIADVQLALFTLVGILVGMSTAWVMGVDRNEIENGLWGYCSALVGAAAFVTWGSGSSGIVAAVLGSVVVVPVQVGLARLLRAGKLSAYGLPVLTAPFCIVSGISAIIARGFPHPPASPLQMLGVSGIAELVEEALEGIGQVHFADSYVAGALILLGLFVGSWRAAAGAVVGAVVMTLVSPIFGIDPNVVAHGLSQYSGVLVGIAALAVFTADVKPAWIPWVLAAVGAVVTLPLEELFEAAHFPMYTWPFVIVTWAIIAVRAYVLERSARS
ncbi:Urea transporter [Dermatophilus congolensis]|uniref:Urea transporter n=1 Tax=Dermatophilus congolensis TaxID=1863 RepID=A0AA46BPY7_9MICO|nr:urea transporter [Dermatophilus congolensis]STD14717.1 Urea transporter [Dermatophilus congolensis]